MTATAVTAPKAPRASKPGYRPLTAADRCDANAAGVERAEVVFWLRGTPTTAEPSLMLCRHHAARHHNALVLQGAVGFTPPRPANTPVHYDPVGS